MEDLLPIHTKSLADPCAVGAAAAPAAAVDPQRMKIEMKLIDSAQQPWFIYDLSLCRISRRQIHPVAQHPHLQQAKDQDRAAAKLCALSGRIWTMGLDNKASENPLGEFIIEKPLLVLLVKNIPIIFRVVGLHAASFLPIRIASMPEHTWRQRKLLQRLLDRTKKKKTS